MHRPVQSGGRRSTAVSQTTELRCVTHGTSPGQPSELPQTRKEQRCLHASTSRCTLELSGRWWMLSSSHHSENTQRPTKPRITRHSICHEDASPPRPIYGFEVYCSCTGTVLVVHYVNGQDVQSGSPAQPTSHPRHLALDVKRPRGENDHSPPHSEENE